MQDDLCIVIKIGSGEKAICRAVDNLDCWANRRSRQQYDYEDDFPYDYDSNWEYEGDEEDEVPY